MEETPFSYHVFLTCVLCLAAVDKLTPQVPVDHRGEQ